MPRLLHRRTDFRNWQPWLIGAPVALVVLLLLRAVLMPDAAASHFYRAQRLQSAGQEQQALRLYHLIVETHPQSAYAPLALRQEGEILTALARRSGDPKLFHQAIAAYSQLATQYSSHSSAGEALLMAGSLALGDLRDTKTAARFYKALLENYAGNSEYTSEATLRLGRIALQEGDASRAQKMFERVLKDFARFPDRCAEAQYHAGVVLETLLKNKGAARVAYEATIKKWPRSVWAGDAKERLGMMTYDAAGNSRPARRVLLEVAAMPKISGGSREAAVRLILAARGLEISDAVWRGWSLSPFRGAFTPDAPGQVLDGDGNWQTVAANAGLVYSHRSAHDATSALNFLRDELDAGHALLVRAGGWLVVVGYDSSRDEIFTCREGADLETWKAKDFAFKWRGDEYSLLSFHAPGERLKASVDKTSTPGAPELLAPSYLYKLPGLSLQAAHRRALRRAAALMKRPREGRTLLNLEALRALKNELDKLARAPDSQVPAPEAGTPDDNAAVPEAESTPLPAATPAAIAPRFTNGDPSARWKNLRKWFGAPLKNWIETRRDAAAFLDAASGDLNDTRLQHAGEELREAMGALDRAASTLPDGNAFETDPDAARQALSAIANEIGNALEAEKRATAAMQSAR